MAVILTMTAFSIRSYKGNVLTIYREKYIIGILSPLNLVSLDCNSDAVESCYQHDKSCIYDFRYSGIPEKFSL